MAVLPIVRTLSWLLRFVNCGYVRIYELDVVIYHETSFGETKSEIRSLLFECIRDTDGRPIRIFGEMVALLQAVGNSGGAIRLEELWNELGLRHAFSLLCAYPIQSFSGADNEESLLCLCHAHDHVIPPRPGPAELHTRERSIVTDFLRRKAIAP